MIVSSSTPSDANVYTRVRYPGELGPPPVQVAFEVPLGWTTDPLPGALAISREPAVGPTGFWANVVVSIDRVGPQTTLDHVITDILLSARSGSAELLIDGERVLEVSGAPAVLRQQTLRLQEDGELLAQFVLVLVVDVGDGVARDCVQITGTVDAGRRDELATAFHHLVRSVVLDD